jgi:hypothetical protein
MMTRLAAKGQKGAPGWGRAAFRCVLLQFNGVSGACTFRNSSCPVCYCTSLHVAFNKLYPWNCWLSRNTNTVLHRVATKSCMQVLPYWLLLAHREKYCEEGQGHATLCKQIIWRKENTAIEFAFSLGTWFA